MSKDAQYFLDRSDKDFEAHGDLLSSSARIVSIINGGAALALLGLLGKLITSDGSKVPFDLDSLTFPIAESIGIFCIGLLSTGVAPLLMGRARHIWGKYNYKYFEYLSDPQENEKPEEDKLARFLTRLSYAVIGIGCLCFAVGAWWMLSEFLKHAYS